MTDDISIPSPTYRVPRYAGGMDPATRKLAMIAAGIGGTMLVVVGGWSMLSHHGQGVPVVQADNGPLRVKPVNPGGLQVAGSGNDIFSGGSDTAVEKLAPPPETPDPQGLRAPPAQPAPVPAALVPAPLAPLAAAPSPADASRMAASARAPASSTRVPAIGASATGASSTGGPITGAPITGARPAVVTLAVPGKAGEKPAAGVATSEHGNTGKRALVQLAALTSEPAARAEWERLVRRWPELFGGHQPAFTKIEHGGQVFWRVRTGGFDGLAQATTFCERLRAKGSGCSVADF